MDTYKHINFEGKDYTIFKINYKDNSLPVLLDNKDFISIKKMNKNWKCNQNGFIMCSHTFNGITKDVYLHELVMLFKNEDEKKQNLNKSIVHINRIGLDNRRENLIFDTQNKETNKNSIKKKRTLKLPITSGINVKEIPTYIWYMKPDYSHGERFIVNIGDVSWKTTSSQEYSLRYKLEEAKLFLRNLLKERSDLLEEYSMNGDYNKDGRKLSKSFYDIIHFAGYKNIQRFIHENKTLEYLKPNYSYLTENELTALTEMRKLIKNDIN